MGKLFFSPNGRINSQAFKRGGVILLAVNFFGWLAWFLSLALGLFFGALSLGLIYCWGCLFAKRFHDAGKSGWWYLPVLALFIMIQGPISGIFARLSKSDLSGIYDQLQAFKNRPAQDMEDIREMLALTERLYQATAIPSAIGFFVTGALIAFVINAALKSNPEINHYGQPQ